MASWTWRGSGIAYSASGLILGLIFRQCLSTRSPAMRIDALRIEAGQEVADAAVLFGLDSVSEASALRWVLRGLPLEMAVRKVKTDREIADNVQAKRRRQRKP